MITSKNIGSILIAIVALFIFKNVLGQKQTTSLLRDIDEEVTDLMKKGDIPGLSLAIITEEETILRNYGYANLETKQKITSETLFELASCSKAFTALTIMDLVEKGKIDLEAHISDYLPWFNVEYEGKIVKVKLKHLLHHTSGIPWETIAQIPESDDHTSLEKTVRVLVGSKLVNEPGESFEYATINYAILALVLEMATHHSFESYIQKNLFDRLGLKNTSIGIPKSRESMAKGYKISFFKPRPFRAPRYRGNNAAGYIISNARDMSKWMKLQMGQTLSDMHKTILSTQVRDKTVPPQGLSSYGKGWVISLSGNDEIFHSGLNPNFSSHVVLRPKENLGVAVLANSNSNYTSLIATQTIKRLANEEPEENLIAGDNNDGFFSMLALALMIYLFVVVAYLIWTISDIIKSKRSFERKSVKDIGQIILSIVLIAPFLFGLFILPEAILGFNWKAILVWTPESAKVLIGLLLGAMAISYIAYIAGVFFPEKNYYKRGVPQIILFSILSGLANVLVIIMITSALNSQVELKYLLFYYSLVLLVYLLGRRFVQIKLTKITVGLVYDMRMKVLSKVLKTSYQKLESINTGRVFTVINDDTAAIGRSAGLLVGLVTSLITILGAFVYMFSISTWATALIVTVMLTLATVYYFVGQSAHKYFEEARDERNIFMSLINGLVDGLKEINQHLKKKEEYKKDLSKSAYRFKEKNMIADIKFINGFMVGESLLLILLGLVSMGLSRLFPTISFYTLMSFVIVLLYLIGPINSVLNSVPEVMRIKVSWDRIQQFLKEIPADLKLDRLSKSSSNIGNIETFKVEDVHFSYPIDASELNNFGIGPINFEVHKGEVLFITGGNGSGKTTLAKILTGLYKPDKGTISIDDQELSNTVLSEHFSTVFNPPYLFKKLYGINILGKESEQENLLELLKLGDKVNIKDGEFSTIDLSSGQRKRLGLLKCYLEDSPIFLFDEWAADQDPEFRYFFYRTLIPQMREQGKIVIAISHDDFYFDIADKIIEMREGQSSFRQTKKVIEEF